MITGLVAVPATLAAQAATSDGLPDWLTILISVTIAVGGGSGLYQILTIRNSKRSLAAGTDKMKMEAADILADSAVALLSPLREELIRTNQRVAELDQQVVDLKKTLNQERVTSETRIRQLEADISERDRHIQVQDAEIIELRKYLKSAPGWPGAGS